MRRWLVLLTAVAIAAGCAGPVGAAARTFALSGRPMADCLLHGVTPAKCGTLTVAENPADPKRRRIDIAVAVMPASDPKPLAPVFFLSGGPGGAAIEDWRLAGSTFFHLGDRHDIVLVDQRGTGESHPLTFPPRLSTETVEQYAERALREMDGDPRLYTTSVAMEDLDAVRAALGYQRIDLYGGSYGATAAQYYMRQHPDRVTAAVLDGGTLLDVPIMELIARNSQLALDSVFSRCLADKACRAAYPNVKQEFATVLARLAARPVRTSWLDDAGAPVVVTRDYFAGVIHNRLLNAGDAATIPRLIHRAWTGDLMEVASSASTGFPDQVMSFEIRCSEAWARYDPREVRATGAGSYYVEAQAGAAELQEAACSMLPRGVVPADDAAPLRTNVPVLLLNGTADPQDPPSNVAGAATQLPGSVLVSVPDQGHTVGHVGCLPSVVVDFFDRSRVDQAAAAACVSTIVPPPFMTD